MCATPSPRRSVRIALRSPSLRSSPASSSHFDALGFPVTTRPPPIQADEALAERWAQVTQDYSHWGGTRALDRLLLVDSAAATYPVPHGARVALWERMLDSAGVRAGHAATHYSTLCALAHLPENGAMLRQVELDVPRTFPQHRHLSHGRRPLHARLMRILSAVALHCAHLGYCQVRRGYSRPRVTP